MKTNKQRFDRIYEKLQMKMQEVHTFDGDKLLDNQVPVDGNLQAHTRAIPTKEAHPLLPDIRLRLVQSHRISPPLPFYSNNHLLNQQSKFS